MPEPREDDDIALDKGECDECNERDSNCTCNQPDVMYADIYED